MKPETFAEQLATLYGDQLEAVILYGSAASRDFTKKYSDYNVLVVLTDVAPTTLMKSGKLVRMWMKKGNPAPLFFTREHFTTSADVFPIEFLDIKHRHKLLIGNNNPLDHLTIHKSNLRHECESELRGKLLALRQIAAIESDRPKQLVKQMLSSFPSISAVFRGLLHLHDVMPKETIEEVLGQLVQHLDFNSRVFFEIASIREGKTLSPRGDEAISLFERYLTELGVITNSVDKMNMGGSNR